MRLRLIAEASKKAISDSAEALGDLIDYVKELGQEAEEYQALFSFLNNPDARTWDNAKWVVDSLIRQVGQSADPEMAGRPNLWAKLKSVTSPIIAVSVYDINADQIKGTPLQNLGISRGLRDKFKKAVGPQGYVGALSNVEGMPHSKLKAMMKDTAKSSAALVTATKKAGLPIKPVPDF